MSWFGQMWRSFVRLIGRDRYTRELEEEIRLHLAMRADEFRNAGMEHRAAMRAARQRFGNVADLTERSRESWGGVWLEQRVHDAKVAVRSLRRTPGFTIAAILTIALGIAAATSVMTVADGVLFAPLPVRDADRVVILHGENPNKQPEHYPLSGAEYAAFARETRSLSRTAAVDYRGAVVGSLYFGDTAMSLRTAYVTGGFFNVLGARPLLGRLLDSTDDQHLVPVPVIIGERVWRSRFGGDPAIIGRVMQGGRLRIVGIADAGLDYPRGAEIWVSFQSGLPASDSLSGWFDVIGRLAPGMTAINARQELGAFLARPTEPHPDARSPFLIPAAKPLREEIVGDVRPVFGIVAAAVGLLLLVTCVNVANLLLVRMLGRRRELAVRAALGAGRTRIAQQTLTECATLSIVGTFLGVLGAWYVARVFAAVAPPEIPRAHSIAMNGHVLVGATALCLVVTALFGCIPAIVGGGVSAVTNLQARGQGEGAGTGRLRGVLVATQLAMAIAMLVAGVAVIRGFDALAHRNLGFHPDHLAIARLSFRHGYGTEDNWKRESLAAIARIRAVPGVTSATGLTQAPFVDAGDDISYSLPGDTPDAATNRPLIQLLGADRDYFRTLGIHIERGRSFTNEDRQGTAPVALVDDLLARQAWPGQDPIGQTIAFGPVLYTVVGVVGPTRYRDLLAARATLYTSYVQSVAGQAGYIWPPNYVAVKINLEAARLIPQLQRAVHESDGGLYLVDAATLGDRIDEALAVQRLGTILLGIFAASVLLLTTLGLYSVAATFIRCREFEIAVRMALGATPMRVRGLVMRQAVPLVIGGTAAGVLGAMVASVSMSRVVAGTNARDTTAIALSIATVCAVAAAAFSLPARRAARANPAEVLRRG